MLAQRSATPTIDGQEELHRGGGMGPGSVPVRSSAFLSPHARTMPPTAFTPSTSHYQRSPFIPPSSSPPAPMFQSPVGRGQRYSLASLATPSVTRKADAETTVFTPIQGTLGQMLRGSMLIEDYSTVAIPSSSSSTQTQHISYSITSRVQHTPSAATPFSPIRSGSPANKTPRAGRSTGFASSNNPTASSSVVPSTAPASSNGFSLLTSISSIFGSSSGKSKADRRRPTPTPSPPIFPPASATPPPMSPSFSEPELPPAVATMTRTVSCNTAGAFDSPIVCGYIPIPRTAAELNGASFDELWDEQLTARGVDWCARINPNLLRSKFAPGMYLKLLAAAHQSGAGGEADEFASKIRKDLTRTFPEAPLFQTDFGKSVLYNILSAYAAYDGPVGYSQGMAFIVGMLMLHMRPTTPMVEEGRANSSDAQQQQPMHSQPHKAHHQPSDFAALQAALDAAAAAQPGTFSPLPTPTLAGASERGDAILLMSPTEQEDSTLSPGEECQPASFSPSDPSSSSPLLLLPPLTDGGVLEERLFWSFVQLMHDRKHNLRAIYTDDCVGLRLLLHTLDQALLALDPHLHAHLLAECAEVSLFATQWFLCVFSYRFPVHFASEVWQQFVEHGVPFLLQMAIQLLVHTRTALLAKRFEQLVPFLAALPQLPADLPERAFAEIELPKRLVEALYPSQMSKKSFKQQKKR